MNRPRVAQLLRELADEIDVEEEAPRVRKARAPRLPSLPAVEVDEVTRARVKAIMRQKGYRDA